MLKHLLSFKEPSFLDFFILFGPQRPGLSTASQFSVPKGLHDTWKWCVMDNVAVHRAKPFSDSSTLLLKPSVTAFFHQMQLKRSWKVQERNVRWCLYGPCGGNTTMNPLQVMTLVLQQIANLLLWLLMRNWHNLNEVTILWHIIV